MDRLASPVDSLCLGEEGSPIRKTVSTVKKSAANRLLAWAAKKRF